MPALNIKPKALQIIDEIFELLDENVEVKEDSGIAGNQPGALCEKITEKHGF